MDQRIVSFADLLDAASLGNLVSLVLYGSAVKKGRAAKDLNLLVVLKKAGSEELLRYRRVLNGPGRRLRVRAVFLTEEDLYRSSDVFPIEHLEMASSYAVLRGRDVLKKLRIDRKNIRHEVEYEARSFLLRLRALAVEKKAWIIPPQVFFEASGAFRLLYRQAASFMKKAPDLPEILERLEAMKKAGRRPSFSSRERLLAELLLAAETLVRIVDGAPGARR